MNLKQRTIVSISAFGALAVASLSAPAAIIAETEANNPLCSVGSIAAPGNSGCTNYSQADLIPGGAHTITGAISGFDVPFSGSNDVDLFRFNVAAGTSLSVNGNSFTATPAYGSFEPNAVLFGSNGVAVAGDDASNGSIVMNYFSATDGVYYLAIQTTGNWPYDTGGNSWIFSGSTGLPLDRWDGYPSGGGSYSLAVNSTAPVPVPGAVWLLGAGLGLGGLVGRRRSS